MSGPKQPVSCSGIRQCRSMPSTAARARRLAETIIQCDVPFPWVLSDTPNMVDRILGAEKVSQVVKGMIRGHRPVAPGAVISPQEVREMVFTLSTHLPGSRQFSRCSRQEVCNLLYPLKSGTLYKTRARSESGNREITATLTVSGAHVVWLEFDDGRGADYAVVTTEAVHKLGAAAGPPSPGRGRFHRGGRHPGRRRPSWRTCTLAGTCRGSFISLGLGREVGDAVRVVVSSRFWLGAIGQLSSGIDWHAQDAPLPSSPRLRGGVAPRRIAS